MAKHSAPSAPAIKSRWFRIRKDSGFYAVESAMFPEPKQSEITEVQSANYSDAAMLRLADEAVDEVNR